ncbi:ABC transporter ATP-binding protein [Shewanella psychropiezotolerans]|uniref:ABC transporter ATP-binding protein n=1 Tax=Shewanella psychropiezotolerans TaxID=2593655 RepID=A0ABX5X1G0_9GAMM|nr:ABC transporter ATP-binding protein [Shewanella psychropiezotolerans]QDO84843.1 ABC transporter ATP-binding protein [Shewanella psychropiezotolerans]
MLLSNDMSRMTAFKAMLSCEQRRVRISIGCAVLCSMVEMVPWLCLYFFVQAIYDQQSPYEYLVVMVGALMARYALYTLAVWYAHLAAYHIIQKIRQHMVLALANMKIDKLRSLKRGDIEKRISDDCQSLEPLIAHHGTDIINGVLMPLFMTVFLFYIDWRIALIALAPLPLALSAQFLMMRGFATRQEKYTQIVSNMHQAQLEFLRSIGVMKLFAVDANSYLELSRTIQSHNTMVSSYTKKMVGAWVTFVTLAQISLILVVPVAIALNNMGQLTLVDLMMVVCISAGILKPWLDLTQVFSQIQQSIVSIDRIIPFCHAKEQSEVVYDQALQQLSCENLTVTRGPSRVFENVNLSFFPGQRVLIEGDSGAGKSTLLSTLSGSLTPEHGGWKINKGFVTDLDDESRSRYIAVVDQEVTFFSGTLRDNLALAKRVIKDDEIWSLLDLLGLKDLVADLPEQLSCDVGEASRCFSGGEMQRLAILRAALAKTPILILDEATAHLDQLSEQTVLAGLRQYSPNQIQLIISHRPRQVKQVDVRLNIIGGNVEEVSLG